MSYEQDAYNEDDWILFINNRCGKTFEPIFNALYPMCVGFCKKYVGDIDDSKDLASIALTKLYYSDGGNIKMARSFLYITMRRDCLNHISHRNIVKRVDMDLAYAQDDEFHQRVFQNEYYLRLYNSLNLLPPQQRRVIEYMLQGLDFREIAAIMNISYQSVANFKTLGVKHMRGEISMRKLKPIEELGPYQKARRLYKNRNVVA